MNRKHQRGSALLTSVVVLLVVTLISLGILRFTARELAGATAAGHEQALVACAEAARKLLVSQFHAIGVQPASIEPLNVDLGSGAKLVGGHYDTAGTAGVEIGQVTYLPANAFGPNDNVRDLTNVIAGPVGQGGRPVKVVVHCQQGGTGTATSGRQLEVEFGVRFGL